MKRFQILRLASMSEGIMKKKSFNQFQHFFVTSDLFIRPRAETSPMKVNYGLSTDDRKTCYFRYGREVTTYLELKYYHLRYITFVT